MKYKYIFTLALNIISHFITLTQKKVEPWKLYTMVSGLLVIDLVILASWQVFDPLQRKLESFPEEKPPSTIDDIKIKPQLEHCESNNQTVWLSKFKIISIVVNRFFFYNKKLLLVFDNMR